MARIAAALFLLVTVAFGQAGPVNVRPTNVDLSDGDAGGFPGGWDMPRAALDAGYSAELRRRDCSGQFSACVLFRSPAVVKNIRAAELAQTFPAGPYIGRKTRFGAWLGTQGSGSGDIELRMRVDHESGWIEFFDSTDGPVDTRKAQWREVVGRVGPDAKFISIWARFHPDGPAWLSDPSFGVVEDAGNRADDEGIRALISRFANARNAHDGYAVSQLYSDDGEFFGPGRPGVVHGRAALAALWGSLPGQVKRTIQSLNFPSSELAVVNVATQYAEPAGRHNETFILGKGKRRMAYPNPPVAGLTGVRERG